MFRIFHRLYRDRLTPEYGLEDLLRGIDYINSFFGLLIPYPAKRISWQALNDMRDTAADLFFENLLTAIFDIRCNPGEACQLLVEKFDQLFEVKPNEDRLFARIGELCTLPATELVNEIKNRMFIEQLSVSEIFAARTFVFTKINHGYWEYLTSAARERACMEPLRQMRRNKLIERCRFTSLLASSLKRQAELSFAGDFQGTTFSSRKISFGLSFNNGDFPTSREIRLPLGPITQGAMTGSLGFFDTYTRSDKYRFHDGGFGKILFWNGELGSFLSKIKDSSDALIFIVPQHLRKIAVRDWAGHSDTIVLPGQVHQLWPAVLPYVAGRLLQILDHFSRLTILVMIGPISTPLGILVDRMSARLPSAELRYFDLGQVLNIVTVPGNHEKGTGAPWVDRNDVRELTMRSQPIPIWLPDDGEKG
jgi:hypothetical protein